MVGWADGKMTWQDIQIAELRATHEPGHRIHCPFQRSYDLKYMCAQCGLGVLRNLREECPFWSLFTALPDCTYCGGTGKMEECDPSGDPCHACKGSGKDRSKYDI